LCCFWLGNKSECVALLLMSRRRAPVALRLMPALAPVAVDVACAVDKEEGVVSVWTRWCFAWMWWCSCNTITQKDELPSSLTKKQTLLRPPPPPIPLSTPPLSLHTHTQADSSSSSSSRSSKSTSPRHVRRCRFQFPSQHALTKTATSAPSSSLSTSPGKEEEGQEGQGGCDSSARAASTETARKSCP